MKTAKNPKTFAAVVRDHKSPVGEYGRIVSKELAPFRGKKVKVTVEALV